MSTIVTICARGGSKGVPGKNLRVLAGKPLIVHTVEQALACENFAGVYVSTDDPEIARVAAAAGATVPFLRPAAMATDASPKLPVIRHLVDWVVENKHPVDRVVDLDPTSPLRSSHDIQAAYELLDANTDLVISAYLADKNPYFNMLELNSDGYADLSKSGDNQIVARQAAPNVYSINGSVYVWWNHSLTDNLWDGRVKLYEMPRCRSIDIDSEIDFKLVELLLAEKSQHA